MARNEHKKAELPSIDGTDDVYIYGYKDIDADTFDIVDIDDEEEFNTAVKAFEAAMAEEDE